MNIFDIYLEKIKSIIINLQKNNQIILPENFNGINAEIPPLKFDYIVMNHSINHFYSGRFECKRNNFFSNSLKLCT